jgi:hypothetical protein
MKLKLAGLLLFSQAANSVRLDSKNYAQYFCDDSLFKPLELIPGHLTSNDEEAVAQQASLVQWEYNRYCYTRSVYEKAVESKKHPEAHACQGDTSPGSATSKESCILRTGMDYASACEEAKRSKVQANREGWNRVMETLKPCNTNSV